MSRSLTPAIAAVLVMAAAAFPAGADSIGPFNFRMPEGWAACAGAKVPAGALLLCPDQGGARISIRTGVGGDDALKMAHLEAPGEVLKELDGLVSGKPGHVTVATSDGIIRASAATPLAGGVIITLTSPRAEADGPARQWGVLVDGATIGEASAPSAPTVTTHKVSVENASTECTAVMFIDGKRIEVPPGGKLPVDVEAGKHVFEWTNPDGTVGSSPGEVPPLARLTGTCVKGAAPPAAPPVSGDAPPAQGLKPRDVFDGARSAVLFYRLCWNLALGGELWSAPIGLDRMMLRVVTRRPVAKRREFVLYAGHHKALTEALARTANAPAERSRLRRYAVLTLIRAGMHAMPRSCDVAAGATPEQQAAALDCIATGLEKSGPADVLDQMNHAMVKVVAAADAPPPGDIPTLNAMGAVKP